MPLPMAAPPIELLDSLRGSARAALHRHVGPPPESVISAEGLDAWMAETARVELVQSAAGEPLPGVWGPGLGGFGPAPSLAILEAVAERSVEAALALHFLGLLALLERPLSTVVSVALPLLEPDAQPLAWSSGHSPTAWLQLTPDGGRWTPADPDGASSWIRPGPLLALNANRWWKPRASEGAWRASAPPVGLPAPTALAAHWAGLGAIACGAAAFALEEAQRYAAQRIQAGVPIEKLEAVRLLQSGAEAEIDFARDRLDRFAAGFPGADGGLAEAARIKTRGIEACCRAVSAALQCFGGYGYMEDYGIERRLRETESLRVLHGSPIAVERWRRDVRKGAGE